ncbi:restriction endonuclease [Enterococcus cecorum]|uniref:restriction endonuclease n=1 Tax=Enterococcus cecorum TaxID=44008 RepID=UPI00200B0519|nr:restriction endonuclease [Enterococcus cecorum]
MDSIISQLHQIHSNQGSIIENLVFLGLRKRGYQIYVGKYGSKEIDFVATKAKETIYIQVTEQLPANSQRETENLLHLPTGHKKMIITNSWMDVGTYEGIAIVHLQDFLLGEG